ncbi:MAG: aminotransferase class I/II-fold pyridoxal phosphate-dependent enzyme, partial [Candidatus Obscuribacterales bacterium]|nr:aminotransferase class I/II-fold pyridoxal phosphate-dependent enzyme [Candidatus Obscuribacterales bacterium]
MNPQDFLRGVLAAALRRLGPSPSRKGRTLPSRLNGITVSKLKAAAGNKSDGSIDLASGAPDFQTPETLKALAIEAITSNQNQYAHPMGDNALRSAIADFAERQWQRPVNPDSQITITTGTSAALAGLILSLVEPGDEVIVLEPFFESYLSAIKLAQGIPRIVGLSGKNWRIDKDSLEQTFSNKTRAVILNTPHNP